LRISRQARKCWRTDSSRLTAEARLVISASSTRFRRRDNSHVLQHIDLAARNLHEVFGENDAARRRAAIDEIFTEDCVLYDPMGGIYSITTRVS
jgi:hypothetical protein